MGVCTFLLRASLRVRMPFQQDDDSASSSEDEVSLSRSSVSCCCSSGGSVLSCMAQPMTLLMREGHQPGQVVLR